MKALSIHALWASAIACNFKTIETRSWPTNYRGELLICSAVADKNRKDIKDSLIFGHALAVAKIKKCDKFKEEDYDPAIVDHDINMDGMYSWHLEDIRPIKPMPIKGQQRIYNTDINKKDITFLKVKNDDELFQYWYDEGYIKALP